MKVNFDYESEKFVEDVGRLVDVENDVEKQEENEDSTQIYRLLVERDESMGELLALVLEKCNIRSIIEKLIAILSENNIRKSSIEQTLSRFIRIQD